MDGGSEELMWRQIYNNLMDSKKYEKKRITDHEKRLQQVDGGFFERFGSLFRENAELAAKQEKDDTCEEIANIEAKLQTDDSESDLIHPDNSDDSSSSDAEEKDDKTDIISAALNIDELYSEVLYEILHNVGSDLNYDIGQTALFSYIQDAFHVSNDYHQNQLNVAEQRGAPKLLLNVEVIEAKDLAPKDSNGFSDPFVTLFLTSNLAHKYNTSVKECTLTPTWEEHFALKMTENAKDDSLCLEVWDFDPAESVKEKFGKLFEVKGVKGVRKLMKEIAVTAAHGQHENELIGKVQIPLSTIPAAGMTMWYSLDKKNKDTRQGIVKVRLSFSSKKNTLVAEQEHRHLLRVLLLHELEKSKVAPHWWCGSFSQQGEAIITQHIIQSGLTPTESTICQWAVYTNIHQNHPLSFILFSNLLDKLIKPLQSHNSLSPEDTKLFWESTKKLLPYCFSVIRKIKKRQADKALIKSVNEVLTIISKISTLDPPPKLDLFPDTLYPWIKEREENISIKDVLMEAISVSAANWFDYIVENNKSNDQSSVSKLLFINQIINLVRCDLQKTIEFFDKLFQQKVGIAYAKELYTFYQQKISELAEEDIVEVCKSLKKLNFTGNTLDQESHKEPLNEGTKLFELYLGIQRFVMLGRGVCPVDCDTFYINNFYKWFHGGVAQWLEMAVFKALQRIEKAVELDSLIPVDDAAKDKYSSSAVDALSIFYQVKIFWQQLNWPDVEGCYTFIAKMIDDICRCGVFYAQKMSQKVDGMGDIQNVYENRFEVTSEWCLAINNIEYVSQALRPFTYTELGMQEVIKKMADLKSPIETERCRSTLENVIINAIDTVKYEILELLETVISKMAPDMKKLLIEGAELFNQDSNSIDRLMSYVDKNLCTLHTELNEGNFERTLYIVWEQLGFILDEIVQSNLEKRRPPVFFSNLYKTLNLMLGSFNTTDESTNCEKLSNIKELLRKYGLETFDLIHEVHLDLYEEYKTVTESPYGMLTVRAKFQGNELEIEILNSQILVAMDSNGLCDAFVRVHMIPEDKFQNHENPKTKTHNKTLVPLFDETFKLTLTDEQRLMRDGLLLFSVKDKDLLGYNNKHVGEAFIHFRDIPDTEVPLTALPQVHLNLARPTNLGATTIKALEFRQGDKLAKEFLKKFKQRMGTVQPKSSS